MNIFFRNCTVVIALLTTVFIPSGLFAQSDKFNVDSINAYVAKLSSDTERVNTLIERAKDIYCEDSGVKLIIANEAKQMAERIKWRRGVYNANQRLGDIYFSCLKNPVRAFEYFRENVTIAKKNDDREAQVQALQTIAKYYQQAEEHEKAIDYFGQALALKPDPYIRISLLGDMGVVFNAIGDFNNARSFYDSSLRLLDSVVKSKKTADKQDTLLRAGLILNIGDILLSEPKPDQAFENYEQVRKISISVQDRLFEVWSLIGIGKTYKVKKDYARALKNYKIALVKCDSIHEYHDEVKILNELANTYLDMWTISQTNSLTDTAKIYADSALRLAETQRYVDLLARTNTTYGAVFMKQGNYTNAIFYLQRALNIAQQTFVLTDKRDAWFGLSNAYELSGQFAQSLTAYKHYKAINDSLTNIEAAKQYVRTTVEREARAEKERRDNEYARGIERQRMFTFYGFAGLALVLLLAFFIFRNYRIQKKYNELLSREKKSHLAHIKAQSNILSDIAHTQAHDVRGPVSTILGLVNLFNYEDPTDPMNKQVMEWIGSTTEKLDGVVKNVIIKENKLRGEHKEEDTPPPPAK